MLTLALVLAMNTLPLCPGTTNIYSNECPTITTNDNVSTIVIGTTNSSAPTCPLGTEPVMRVTGQYACAPTDKLVVPFSQ